MALVKTFNASELKEEFRQFNRDYFSYEACEAIIEFFEETDCGKNTELDIIGLCCDFNEETPEYIQDEYDNIPEFAECQNEDGEIDIDKLMDALNYYTWAVLLSNGNILYINF